VADRCGRPANEHSSEMEAEARFAMTALPEIPPAPDPPPRRLTLADAMLLVAVMAAGLILLRIADGLGLFVRSTPTRRLPPGRDLVEFLSVGGGCVLLPLALFVVVMTLRDRGPARRDSTQRPGFVACLAVLLATILPIADFVVRVAAADDLNRTNEVILNFNNSFGGLKNGAAPMIVGAWLALVLTGRWRPGADWIDRLGCCIGGGFVIMNAYTELYFLWVSSL
jgi:hypothetical protein